MIDIANWDKSEKPFIKFTFTLIPQSRVLYKSSDGGKLIIRNFTRVQSATTVF